MVIVYFIIAWICTLAGDWFLSVTQTHLTAGIALFCVVQTMYMLYLKPSRRNLAARPVILIAGICILALIRMLTLQNILAVLDIALLGMNAVSAWRQSRKIRRMILFAVGLSLFFCCDVCVGLRSILPQELSMLMLILIWSFYLPSQIIIVIYGIKEIKCSIIYRCKEGMEDDDCRKVLYEKKRRE